MKNKVYKVSQELADYVGSFNQHSDIFYVGSNEISDKLLNEIETVCSTSNSYQYNLVELWYAYQYGYMEVIEDLYYVQFVKGNRSSYLNKSCTGTLFIASNMDTFGSRNKFKLAEIKAIDERYLPFAVKVDK